MRTLNLCFETKIRKNVHFVYSCKSHFNCIKVYFFYGHVSLMVAISGIVGHDFACLQDSALMLLTFLMCV